MSSSLAVETSSITKSFGGTEIVRSCSMHVKEGTIYGFLRENGAGKTTVFKMLSCIFRPTAGSIKIFGLDVATQRTAVLKQIGTLIGTPVFYEHLSAIENLKLHLSYMGGVGLDPHVALAAIGLISMRIGFLTTSFACSVLLSNLLGVSLLADLDAALLGFTIFAIVLSTVAVVLIVGLTNRVNQMEGE